MTGGWSTFVQGTDLKNKTEKYFLVSGMAVTKNRCTDIIVASIFERILHGPPQILYRQSKDMVTKQLLETSEHLVYFDYFQDGSLECHTTSISQECVNALRAGSSHVDEVHLVSTETFTTVQYLRMCCPPVRLLHLSSPDQSRTQVTAQDFTTFHILWRM